MALEFAICPWSSNSQFQSARSLQGSGGTSCRDVFEQMIRCRQRQVQSPLTERRQRAGDPREDRGPGRTGEGPKAPPRGRGQVNRTRPTAPLHINHRQGNLTQSLCWAVDTQPVENGAPRPGASKSSEVDGPLLSPYNKVSGFAPIVIVITFSRLGEGAATN